MKLSDFGLVCDENVDEPVVRFLRDSGFDVVRSADRVGAGASDLHVIRSAFAERRVVVTHDRDFGGLAVASKEPLIGIVFIRPGHVRPEFTIDSLRTFLLRDTPLTPPFIVVLERSGTGMTFRIRQPL